MRMLLFVVRMRSTAKLLLRWIHGSTLIFYAKTISSMDWITLYNVYSPIKMTRELWEFLDRKYKTEDTGMEKFVVGRFLDYKMVMDQLISTRLDL